MPVDATLGTFPDVGSIPTASTSLRSSAARNEGCRAIALCEGGQWGDALELRLGRPATMPFFYVYILESQQHSKRYYIGFTIDLESRLRKHNDSEVPHTSKYGPWRIKTAIAFTDEKRARSFERYLKSPSGRAFSIKRL